MPLSKRYPSKRRRAVRVARARARCVAVREYVELVTRERFRGWELLTRETLEPIFEQMRATLATMGLPPGEGQIVYFEQGPGETYSATLSDAVGPFSVVSGIDRDAGVIALGCEDIDRERGALILSGMRPEAAQRASETEAAFSAGMRAAQ